MNMSRYLSRMLDCVFVQEFDIGIFFNEFPKTGLVIDLTFKFFVSRSKNEKNMELLLHISL